MKNPGEWLKLRISYLQDSQMIFGKHALRFQNFMTLSSSVKSLWPLIKPDNIPIQDKLWSDDFCDQKKSPTRLRWEKTSVLEILLVLSDHGKGVSKKSAIMSFIVNELWVYSCD